MSGPRPVLFSTATLRGPSLDRLERRFELVVEPWLTPAPVRILSEEHLAARCRDLGARVLVVEAEAVGSTVLEGCDSLAVLAATRGDPWNLDVEAATRAGVLALRTPGRNAVAVAEMTIGLLIAAARGIVTADSDVRGGRFVVGARIPQQRFRGPCLTCHTLGLVGAGAVGREVASRAAALGMTVVAYDPAGMPEGVERCPDLPSLLRRSEYLSIHAPLNDATRGMIGADQLSMLPQGAYLVNTAREPIVDRTALIAALTSGRLGGAALDHFAGEFLPPDDPLCSLPNVVLTPHIGGASADADACHTTMLADDFDTLFAGGALPAGALNPEVATKAMRSLQA